MIQGDIGRIEKTSNEEKMNQTKTHRGFALSEFKDYYGDKCSLQKSSLATEDCIWLGVDNADPKILASQAPKHGITTAQTTGWVTYPVPEGVSFNTRMHLSREQVAELLPHLQRFVATGEV